MATRRASGPPGRRLDPGLTAGLLRRSAGAVRVAHKIGATAFARIERAWVGQYQSRSASTEDFIALAPRVACRDLTGFLRAWLYGSTTPPMPGHPDWTMDPVVTGSAVATADLIRSPRPRP